MTKNKLKIINDPIYGFINIPSNLVYDIIEHPYFQRLRRIQQLGLSNLVYPGATHTRFQHALGAMHLMMTALNELKSKNVEITPEEYEAACCAILLHDIGHGPFSHTLEHTILPFHHEEISTAIIQKLNNCFSNKLQLAMQIFNNTYHKTFLSQLVSGQLDVDRMDYLMRDSFYTGVIEGKIGYDRIIKMLCVVDNKLAVEYKGIYSIEDFLVSRRVMYWQVYLHKTVIAAENMLIQTMKRARKIKANGDDNLNYFINNTPKLLNDEVLQQFLSLDDSNVIIALKKFMVHDDKILSLLSSGIMNRNIFKIKLQNSPFNELITKETQQKIQKKYNINESEMSFLQIINTTQNSAYNAQKESINILMKNGDLKELADISDNSILHYLANDVKKYYHCFLE